MEENWTNKVNNGKKKESFTVFSIHSYLKRKSRGISFDVIVAPYPWKNLICGSEWSVFCWHIASYLCHYLKQRYLFQVCGFATLWTNKTSQQKQATSSKLKDKEIKLKRSIDFIRLLTMLGPVISWKFDPSVAYCKIKNGNRLWGVYTRSSEVPSEGLFFPSARTVEMTTHVSLFLTKVAPPPPCFIK